MKRIITLSVLFAVSIALTAGVALANYGNKNSLSGYVKEQGTLMGIKGAKVKVYTKGGTKKGSDTTSLKGKYSIKKLNEKKYVVRVTAAGYHDPKNVQRTKLSSTVKVDGSKNRNFYFVK